MRYLLSALLLFSAVSCQPSDKFLEKVPPPPPAPPRTTKVYKFDLNKSETAAVDVDILWVIDNSGSMDPYQQKVIQNSSAFMKQFTSSTRLRWKMGLISTSYGEQPYMGFRSVVDYTTLDAEGQFNAAVARLGVNGDGRERTFDPVLRHLRDYPQFVRPSAFLVIIAVSDENEYSSGTSVDSFLNQMGKILGGDNSQLAVFGVFGAKANGIDEDRTQNFKYKEVVERTGGKMYPLETGDYGPLLAELGKDLIQRTSSVNPAVVLDQKPMPETIEVVYKGRRLRPGPAVTGGEWTYDSQYNRILISNPAILDGRNLNVTVSYVIDDPATWGI